MKKQVDVRRLLFSVLPLCDVLNVASRHGYACHTLAWTKSFQAAMFVSHHHVCNSADIPRKRLGAMQRPDTIKLKQLPIGSCWLTCTRVVNRLGYQHQQLLSKSKVHRVNHFI